MWGVCGRCTEMSCRPPNTYSWTLHLSYPHTLPVPLFAARVPWFFRRCPITKSIHDAASAKLAMEDLVDAEGKGGESGDTTVKTLEATTTTQVATEVVQSRLKAQEVVEEKRAADEAAAAKREAESKELNARRSSLSSVEGSVVAMAKAQSEAKVEDVPVVVEASEPTHAVEEPTYMPVGEAAFTLEQLASGGTANNVDPTKKELYLSDAEFADVFKMDKAAWEKQPKWKRVQEKKKKGIF